MAGSPKKRARRLAAEQAALAATSSAPAQKQGAVSQGESAPSSEPHRRVSQARERASDFTPKPVNDAAAHQIAAVQSVTLNCEERLAAAQDDIVEMVRSNVPMSVIAKTYSVRLSRLYRWVDGDAERQRAIARAREDSAESLVSSVDELLMAAIDHFQLLKAEKIGNHRRWLASKRDPRRFGDKLDITSDSKSVRPIDDIDRELRSLVQQHFMNRPGFRGGSTL